jgi:hypothetical protein
MSVEKKDQKINSKFHHLSNVKLEFFLKKISKNFKSLFKESMFVKSMLIKLN